MTTEVCTHRLKVRLLGLDARYWECAPEGCGAIFEAIFVDGQPDWARTDDDIDALRARLAAGTEGER